MRRQDEVKWVLNLHYLWPNKGWKMKNVLPEYAEWRASLASPSSRSDFTICASIFFCTLYFITKYKGEACKLIDQWFSSHSYNAQTIQFFSLPISIFPLLSRLSRVQYSRSASSRHRQSVRSRCLSGVRGRSARSVSALCQTCLLRSSHWGRAVLTRLRHMYGAGTAQVLIFACLKSQ